MFISVRRYYVDSSTDLKDVTDKVEAEFVPRINAIAGLLTYYMMITGDHEITSVSIFETAMGAERSDVLAAEWVAEAFPAGLLSRLELTEGQVVIGDR